MKRVPTDGLSPRGRGNRYLYHQLRVFAGLSPRGRGNRAPVCVDHVDKRSIPAWAGEPPVSSPAMSLGMFPVYPRVGGGTWTTAISCSPLPTVYPRVGGGTVSPVYPRVGGGTSGSRMDEIDIGRVYPRVGGGTDSLCNLPHLVQGLSPRGRGNRCRQVPYVFGLSPRGRGNPDPEPPRPKGNLGLSPRGRGNLLRSHGTRSESNTKKVYPRVGGGTHGATDPRTQRRSIPAWAGEPGFPKRCRRKDSLPGGLSPRGRGNQH